MNDRGEEGQGRTPGRGSFDDVLDTVADAIIATDEDQQIVLFNKGAEHTFGYQKEEVLGRPLQLLVSPSRTQGHYLLLPASDTGAEETWSTSDRRELIGRRKDGSQFPAEVSISELTREGRTIVTGVLRDVTQRKQNEERIQRQVQHLSALRAVDIAITSSLDLRVILSVLLDQVTTQLGVDAAAALLLNPSSQTLEYIAGRGFRTHAFLQARLHLGEGCAGRAARDRRLVRLFAATETKDQLAHNRLLVAESFMTSYATPLIVKGQVRGVLEVSHRAWLDPDQEWLDLLDAFAQQAAIAFDAAGLFEDLQRATAELTVAYDATLEGWARALELRDVETQGHSQRVTEMTLYLARAMGMDEEELVHLRRGGLLHDIGKMGIPDQLLFKPAPLTESEWEIMRRHPTYAYEMLLPIDYLRPALEIPYCHHEKWDGSGYPRGLRGEEIPLAARLFAVADTWDALRSDRPYRAAWSTEEVQDYVRSRSGAHFDPEVVDVFLQLAPSEPSRTRG